MGAPGINNCFKGLSTLMPVPNKQHNWWAMHTSGPCKLQRKALWKFWEKWNNSGLGGQCNNYQEKFKVMKVGLTNGFLQIYGVYRKSAVSNAFAHLENISPIPILLGNIICLTFVTINPLEVEQLICTFLMMKNSKSVQVFSNMFSLTNVNFRFKNTHDFVLWGAC